MLDSFWNDPPVRAVMSTLAKHSAAGFAACALIGQLAHAQAPKQEPPAIRDAKVSDVQRLATASIHLATGPPFNEERKPPQGQRWLSVTTQLNVTAAGADLSPGKIALVSGPEKTFPALGIAIGAANGGKYPYSLFEHAKLFGNRGQIDKDGKMVFVLVNLADGAHLSFQKKDVGEIRLLFAVPEGANVSHLQLGDALKLPLPAIR